MNHKLDNEARYRADEGFGVQTPGNCQRWIRQLVQAVYGDRYDDWWRDSAKHTAEAFLADPPPGAVVLETSDPADTQVGDLLYKRRGSGGFGHVGIRVTGNRVAENSSTAYGRTHGAIGYRYLLRGEAQSAAAWFGRFDLVVRLPEV